MYIKWTEHAHLSQQFNRFVGICVKWMFDMQTIECSKRSCISSHTSSTSRQNLVKCVYISVHVNKTLERTWIHEFKRVVSTALGTKYHQTNKSKSFIRGKTMRVQFSYTQIRVYINRQTSIFMLYINEMENLFVSIYMDVIK